MSSHHAYTRAPERFWKQVDQRGPDECWPWMGYKDAAGYGRAGKRGTTAHRVALRLSGVEIPEGMFVLHSCDNPPCCNPAHLRAGTPAENMADRSARTKEWRERCGPARQFDRQVAAALLASGTSMREAARKLGVTHSAIGRAIKEGQL